MTTPPSTEYILLTNRTSTCRLFVRNVMGRNRNVLRVENLQTTWSVSTNRGRNEKRSPTFIELPQFHLQKPKLCRSELGAPHLTGARIAEATKLPAPEPHDPSSLPLLLPTLAGVSTMEPPTLTSYLMGHVQALWPFLLHLAGWRHHHDWSLGRKWRTPPTRGRLNIRLGFSIFPRQCIQSTPIRKHSGYRAFLFTTGKCSCKSPPLLRSGWTMLTISPNPAEWSSYLFVRCTVATSPSQNSKR